MFRYMALLKLKTTLFYIKKKKTRTKLESNWICTSIKIIDSAFRFTANFSGTEDETILSTDEQHVQK